MLHPYLIYTPYREEVANNTGLLRSIRRGISLPPETAQQRNAPTQVVVEPRVARSQPVTPAGNRAFSAEGRHSVVLDELDVVDSVVAPFLVCLPDRDLACPVHDHGYWWEDRAGNLHCVSCWPGPPLRSMVRNVWESRLAGGALVEVGFAAGAQVFVCRTDGALHWPWPETEGTTPKPTEF